ncbi:MAG: dTDP-4-dehydrorhamnose 3,5-epimerase [Bacillaceae bacterium]|nr:dTDP-4-dehydrorhamnose 3,5-epimerase [Bacillaceae bacterium]
MPEFVVRLAPEAEKALTFQDYGPQASIEGVLHQPLKKHRAVEGWFMEYLRLTGGHAQSLLVPFDVRQISFSKAVPRRINAFHVHPKERQDEIWTVVDGTLMVWLVDCRADSSTCGVKRRYVLSGEEPALLYIPSGVAHGYKAGPEGALLVYAMNNQFNAADPNEGRLPWDYFGADLWEDDRG